MFTLYKFELRKIISRKIVWIIRYRRFILQWNCSEGYQDMLMEFTGRHEHANLVRVILSETMTLLLVADCWKICVRCSWQMDYLLIMSLLKVIMG